MSNNIEGKAVVITGANSGAKWPGLGQKARLSP